MKAPLKAEVPSNNININKSANLSELREKTGALTRWKVNRATSRAAGDALKEIEYEKVTAEKHIAVTATKLAEAGICTSLVSNAMPQIGALATRVNAATTAVDQALTNGAAAEVYTHLSNRSANLKLANELQANGKIEKEEAAVLNSFAQADASEDIERSRQRMAEAKEAVAALHGFALKGIADAKNRIS